MEDINNLKSAIDIPVNTIAVVASTRQNQLDGIIGVIHAAYPLAKYLIITRYGEHNLQKSFSPEIKIVKAMPPGAFNLSKMLLIKRDAISHVKADIVILAYNNPEGAGYCSLKIACMTLRAKKVVGVFYNAHNAGQCSYEEIKAGFAIFECVRRIFLLPLELALLLITITMLVIARLLYVLGR